MRAWWQRAGAVVVVIAAATAPLVARADDDVPAEAAPRPVPARPLQLRVAGAHGPAGIDLAAHVDVNVVLPMNQWRIAGGLQNLVVAGGGRLVIDGNLTIGGEPVPEGEERIRRTDERLMAALRRSQRERLAAVVADPGVPADRRRALELATESDIRRVTSDVARLRDLYRGRRAQLGDEDWQQFQRDVQVCRRAIADPFGDDSLFAAVRAGLEADRRE